MFSNDDNFNETFNSTSYFKVKKMVKNYTLQFAVHEKGAVKVKMRHTFYLSIL